jgi:sulfite exporter TauE/SafE
MTLLWALLPIYLLGNLHCIGMCGPLVMMLSKQRYRHFYFLGRIASYTLAGMLAGASGAVINTFLERYHIPASTSFLCGFIILTAGICTLMDRQYPGYKYLGRLMAPFQHRLSSLMLKDRPWPTFLFGFFTILLPCGQTLIVFTACALFGDVLIGLVNGFVFALLTSPSLFLAMHAHKLLGRFKNHQHIAIGLSAIVIGILSLCRGLAEIGILPHLVIKPGFASYDHIVLF